MRKGIVTMLMLALLVAAVPAMASEGGAQGVVICDTLSIRQTPSTGEEPIAIASNGDILTVLGEQGSWYQIRFDDATTGAHGEGYVLKRFLAVNPDYATALGDTFVYAMPSSDALMVGQVEGGESLVVIGEWDGYWAVNLRTASGFVRKEDVDYSGTVSQTPRPTNRPQPTATPVNPVAQNWYLLVRDSALRAGPSSTAAVEGEMIAGSYVLIGRIQGGYGQVADNGFWLAMGDMQRVDGTYPPVETAAPGAARYLVIVNGAKVYAEPDYDSQVVDTLNDGDAVTVSQIKDGMGLVSYGRQRGWMQMIDLLSFAR